MSRAGNAFVCGLIISAGAILCCLSPPDTCSLALASHPRARKTRETWNRKFCCLAASHFSRVQVLSPKSRCRCRCSYFWCSREDYLKSESAHTRIGVLLWPRLELSSRFLVWSHRVDGASFFVFLWSCSAHKKKQSRHSSMNQAENQSRFQHVFLVPSACTTSLPVLLVSTLSRLLLLI